MRTKHKSFGPFQHIIDEWRAIACYRIIRFYRDDGRRPRTIKQGLTLAEAQAHCSREDTHGPGWFDGYDYMKGFRPKDES